MTTKIDKIKKNPLFEGLRDDELLLAKELFSAVRTVYAKGEYLLRAAEPFCASGSCFRVRSRFIWTISTVKE